MSYSAANLPAPKRTRSVGIIIAVALFSLSTACGDESSESVETEVPSTPTDEEAVLVDQDSFATENAFYGDIHVISQQELEPYLEYERVVGNVTFASPDMKTFSWPNLTKIDGNLWIWSNTEMHSFDFGALETVGGTLLIRDNGTLIDFAMHKLAEIGGRLSIVYNFQLSECIAHDLHKAIGDNNIGDSVTIKDNKPEAGCGD